jgi:hypothetical protein
VPLERARGPVSDDGPAVPHEARPLLRRARDEAPRLVHDEIGTWEERALFYQIIMFMCIIPLFQASFPASAFTTTKK